MKDIIQGLLEAGRKKDQPCMPYTLQCHRVVQPQFILSLQQGLLETFLKKEFLEVLGLQQSQRQRGVVREAMQTANAERRCSRMSFRLCRKKERTVVRKGYPHPLIILTTTSIQIINWQHSVGSKAQSEKTALFYVTPLA